METFNRIKPDRAKLAIPLLIVAHLFFFLTAVPAQNQELPDLTELGLEELMNIEITSVSKKPQKISEAAAAIFVITSEDIRRSGATSIPEALRMVPGLEVARIDASKWAITSRGFNGRFANKLLVLMDGRSVYTPQYSGVYWDIQDTMLEDLDRIEIIRGPGATLWGANAVNGVINIITKHSKDTRGGLVTAGGGTEERAFGSIRYGGKSDDDTYYRVYAKYFKRDEAVYASGDDAADDWDTLRGGFRVDLKVWGGDSLTLQGDIYDGKSGDEITIAAPFPKLTFNETTDFRGANVLGRWERTLSDTSDLALQVYYDRTDYSAKTLDEIRDTFDMDFQHRFSLGEKHGIIWGLGYRYTRDNIDNSIATIFDPDRRHDDLWSAFVQDDISLVDGKFRITLGSKFEHNDYTGFEIQPNIRLIWTPKKLYSLWAAVSRAVRTPSRAENDVITYMSVPFLPAGVRVYGNSDFDSEDLIAYELGFRTRPVDNLAIDIAAFYNDYDNLRTFEMGGIWPNIWFDAGNKMDGSTYGVELALDWRVFDWWRLAGAYTFLKMQLHLDGDSRDPFSEDAEGEIPRHQASLRSSMDLMKNLQLDSWVRYVDHLPSQGVDSYVTLDLRLAWEPRKDLELSIVGQNLLDSQRPEFMPEIVATTPTEVQRGVYGKITWKFSPAK
jgi:iron complex outermembrane receptor protein